MKEKFFHQLLSMFRVTPEYPETLIPSVEETARILKTNPEIYKRFENAYQTSDAIGIPGYPVNAKQAAREKEGVDTSAPDLSSLMNRIVRELENDTFIWQYTDGTVSPFSINIPEITEIPEPVTVEELNIVPREYRPQLAGNIVCRGWNDHAGRQAAYWYNLAVTEKSEKKREEAYSMFRKSLDILNPDPVTYKMIGMHVNSMGYWLPKMVNAIKEDGFFKIPDTTIIKIPLPLLQLTFLEYSDINRTTLDIVDDYCRKVFSLDETKEYFIKTGVFSSKYDFRNARVSGSKEVRELGEYLLYIHGFSRVVGGPTSYGAATTNEWVVRDFIPDTENNPTIYHGLPLHTEYRVFVDFNATDPFEQVLGISPYWEPKTMKNHFMPLAEGRSGMNPEAYHDYCTYSVAEEKLMKRYEENKERVLDHVLNIVRCNEQMHGQWSMDIMQNGNDFWFIDMATASESALKECIPKGKLKKMKENWIPEIR